MDRGEWGRLDERKESIVFFIGDMSHSGGTERVLSVIANGLSDRGYPVTVVSLWGDGRTFFPMGRQVKVRWIKRECPKAGIPGRLKFLCSVLRKADARILVDVDMILGCYSLFMKWRIPGLYWISWEHFYYDFPFERYRLVRKAVRRLAGRYADRLVVLTRADRQVYAGRMALKNRIVCIHDPAPFDTGYEKEEETPMIFGAGRLTKVKGFDMLLKSWKLLEEKYPRWTMVIAGCGEEREALEKQAGDLGLKRLTFAGNVPDIEAYYQKAAFFVLPSRNEGFGMALLEAMCFGLPAVCYACRMGPKEIVEDQKTGFLVEPGDISAFAGKMEVLMRDMELRRQMGQAAARSAGRFEREKILDKWESLISGR